MIFLEILTWVLVPIMIWAGTVFVNIGMELGPINQSKQREAHGIALLCFAVATILMVVATRGGS